MFDVRHPFKLATAFALVTSAACGPTERAEAPARDTPAAGSAVAGTAPSPDLACWLRASPEEAAQRPSPLGQVELSFGDQAGLLCYGRPSARERVVMGELVPLGAPWRAGANEATALHLPFPAEVGGVALAAGSYSLYAIPGESEWEVVLNGSAERWGIPIGDEVRAEDVGSFTVSPDTTEDRVETLTYSWESHGPGMGHLVMEWERTRIEIPVHGPGM